MLHNSLQAVCIALCLSSSLIHAQSNVSTPQTIQSAGAVPTVTLTGVHDEKATVTIVDIETLPRTTVTVFNSHAHVRQSYGGVLLSSLLARINAPLGEKLHGNALSFYLTGVGSDRYTAVYSLAEIDPTMHPGSVLIADTLNGMPLPAEQGPLQLINTQDKRPARWVRNLVAIQLRSTE